MKISIIVAVAENNIIGYKNKLPWHLPADLANFKKITTRHHVVMGQRTFESIGKPLPGRKIIILSDEPRYKQKGCKIAHSINEAIQIAKKADEKELIIAGGASIYKQFLSIADKIYLTKIGQRFNGDAYFPKIDRGKWKETSKKTYKKGKNNLFDFEFITLQKVH